MLYYIYFFIICSHAVFAAQELPPAQNQQKSAVLCNALEMRLPINQLRTIVLDYIGYEKTEDLIRPSVLFGIASSKNGHSIAASMGMSSPHNNQVYDKVVQVWTRKNNTYKKLKKLSTKSDGFDAVSLNILKYSPDGSMLAGIGKNIGSEALFVWFISEDMHRNKPYIYETTHAIHSIAFFAHNTHIAIGTSHGIEILALPHKNSKLQNRRAKEQKIDLILKLPFQQNESTAFSPDGKYIIAGSKNGSIRIWNKKQNNHMSVIFNAQKIHAGAIKQVLINSSGEYVITRTDQEIKIWHIHDHKYHEMQTIAGLDIAQLDMADNGNMLWYMDDIIENNVKMGVSINIWLKKADGNFELAHHIPFIYAHDLSPGVMQFLGDTPSSLIIYENKDLAIWHNQKLALQENALKKSSYDINLKEIKALEDQKNKPAAQPNS
jgi:hypothetical protein